MLGEAARTDQPHRPHDVRAQQVQHPCHAGLPARSEAHHGVAPDQLIADLTGGRAPSAGFVHGMLARCAVVLAEVVKLIKTAVTLAAVAGLDETTIRCGPAGGRKYILSGSAETAAACHLGGRDLGSFTAFGILQSFAGIAVHDRYGCYFHKGWANLAGHQVRLAHLVCDFEDAAESWPAAIWPIQAQRALRGLIRAWHAARGQGLPEIPASARDPLVSEFRHAVLAGCADVPRIRGPRSSTASTLAGICWSSAATGPQR